MINMILNGLLVNVDEDCVYIDLLVIRESITEKWIDIDTACR